MRPDVPRRGPDVRRGLWSNADERRGWGKAKQGVFDIRRQPQVRNRKVDKRSRASERVVSRVSSKRSKKKKSDEPESLPTSLKKTSLR